MMFIAFRQASFCRPKSRLARAALALVLVLGSQIVLPTAAMATTTFVVAATPGGTNDIVARVLAPFIGTEINDSVVVDNKPGAGGNIGALYVARSAPDKGVWLLTTSAVAVMNPSLVKNSGFDPTRDLEPVSGIVKVQHVMLVNKASSVASVSDLVNEARKKPGALFFGSSGNGSPSHLMMEQLKRATSTDIGHIPFKGVLPAMTELLAGRIDVLISTIPSALPYIRNGDVKAIAVLSSEPSDLLANVPVAKDAYPTLTGDLWVALYAPKGTKPDQLRQMRNAIVKALADPATMDALRKLGASPFNLSPEQLGQVTKDEFGMWSRVIQQAGIQPD